MSQNAESYESSLNHVNTYSSPSDLRINDMRISTIIGAPMRCPLIKISTNQGIEGYGEVRDGASKRYALMLKSRILGENPCNVDRLFRRIKQFGHHSRQGGGVCGVELAQDYGVAMAVHMAESPIACMAAVHSVAATENFVALENHSIEIPWWNEIAVGLPNPIVQNGYIEVPDGPGLGIEALDDEVIEAHLDPGEPGLWAPTDEWDEDLSNDRLWS